MEQYIGKRVFLRLDVGGNSLVFNARITEVSSTHITFIDKFNKKYTYRISDIVEMKEEGPEDGFRRS